MKIFSQGNDDRFWVIERKVKGTAIFNNKRLAVIDRLKQKLDKLEFLENILNGEENQELQCEIQETQAVLSEWQDKSRVFAILDEEELYFDLKINNDYMLELDRAIKIQALSNSRA